MPRFLRTPLVCAAALVSLGVGLAACGSGSGPASSSSSATVLLAAALKNAIAGKWVHEVVTATEPGHTFSMNNAIGTSTGRQSIDSDGAKSTTELVSNVAYLRGDLKAIVNYFRFSTKHPGAIAGRWISVSATSSGFATVAAGVTLATDFQRIGLLGMTKGPVQTIDGQRVIPLQGHLRSSSGAAAPSAVIYVTVTGTILPVEYRATSGKISQTIIWSEWGRAVTIAAPAASIPISSIKS